MRHFRLQVLALLPLLPFTTATTCAAPALPLPITNVSTTPGHLHIGIPLDLGHPAQRIALVPSLQAVDTFIPRWGSSCIEDVGLSNGVNNGTGLRLGMEIGNATTGVGRRVRRRGVKLAAVVRGGEEKEEALNEEKSALCAHLYGGAYLPTLSHTFINLTSPSTGSPANTTRFNDTFALADYASLYTNAYHAVPPAANLSATFMMADEGKPFPYGAALLGLAPGSSMLKTLKEKGLAPSESWSLKRTALCLGCVDAGAVAGEWHIIKPTAASTSTSDTKQDKPNDVEKSAGNCVLQVSVLALLYYPSTTTLSEGASLTTAPFTACLDPGIPFLVLPPSATTAFEHASARHVSARYDDALVFSGPPGPDTARLVFRLEGGLEVNVTVPGGGGAVPAERPGEWSVPLGTGAWGAYGSGTWVLGKPFTDAVVVRWDSEKSEYGIANAHADIDVDTDADVAERKADIQPLGCTAFPAVAKSVATTPGTGIIVGSVIGGFLGGLVFAVAGLWFFKRGRDGAKARYAQRYKQLDEDMVPMRAVAGTSGGGYRDSWVTAGGALSPPPPSSVRESLRKASAGRVVSMEVPDTQVHEAPEGGRGAR